LDIPLSARGRAELADLATQFRPLGIREVFATSGEAARESATYLAEQLDAKVRFLDDLKNQDLGLWQGLTVDEVRRRHKRVFKQWEESPCAVCPPAGEMVDQVLERVQKGLKPVLKRCRRRPVLLVAPDPLRKVIRCHLKGIDVADPSAHENGARWELIEAPS
jgi:broad specificity phosphatase PhoE